MVTPLAIGSVVSARVFASTDPSIVRENTGEPGYHEVIST